jgi:hypothetical protein
MSNETTEARVLAGDFMSESAPRGVFGRRRQRPPRTTKPPNGLPANPTTAIGDTSPPTDGPGPLRRWSVAELIARAGAAPPRTA